MKFKIQATPESINSSAGLVPAGRLIDHLKFDKTLDNTTVNETTLHDVPNSSCVRSYLGLLVEGRTAFEEVEARRNDKLFSDALDIGLVPSAATMGWVCFHMPRRRIRLPRVPLRSTGCAWWLTHALRSGTMTFWRGRWALCWTLTPVPQCARIRSVVTRRGR